MMKFLLRYIDVVLCWSLRTPALILSKNLSLRLFLISFLFLLTIPHLKAQRTIYVNDDAVGLNDGSNWANAFTDLQSGLAIAQFGDEIWVAKGIYKPTNNVDRSIAFRLKNGVAIYGGFEGTETAIDQRDLTKIDGLQAYIETIAEDGLNKDILVNTFSASVLSGDIGQPVNPLDNSYSVVIGENIDSTAILVGFVITEGNASDRNTPQEFLGGGMYNLNSSPTISRCSFIFSQALFDGGGIYNDKSSPSFFKCSIISNTAPFGGGFSNKFQSSPKLDSCRIVSNSGNSGGGMYNEQSSPILTNCYFKSNEVRDNGGAMNNYFSPLVLLTNCHFEANKANNIHGGGVYSSNTTLILDSCIFLANTANKYGGGMWSFRSSHTVLNSEFIFNRADAGGGMANDESSPTLIKSTFERNYARLSGGGIFNEPRSSPTLKNCRFEADTANNYGGGIFNGYDSNAILDSCYFGRNIAQYGGGMNNYISTLNLRNCHFELNKANYGGGINNSRSPMELEDCIFIQNIAETSGGGINNTYSEQQLDNCLFEGNSATYGGGMHNFQNAPTLKKCVFRENNAEVNGGGYDNNESTSILDSCEFEANTARFGGGMNNWECSPELTDCVFKNNQATRNASANFGGDGGAVRNYRSFARITNCSFDSNSAEVNGGGMFNDESAPNLTGCTLKFNQAINYGGAIYNNNTSNGLLIENCDIESNTAIQGGGIFNWTSSPTLMNCHFLSNEVTLDGGAIYNFNGSAPSLNDCLFESNKSGRSGAAMVNSVSANPKMGNCRFISNLASVDGGGVFNFRSSPFLNSCYFDSNQANRSGGGMINNQSSPFLDSCRFVSNDARDSGGGIINIDSDPKLFRCTFTSNTVLFFGAGIQNVRSNPELDLCMFISNRAQDNGGGMNNDESVPILTNCEFSQNYSRLSGGGIANQPASSPTLLNCTFKENTAGVNGGGMFSGFLSAPILDECNFESNQAINGGAMNNFQSSPLLRDCKMIGNKANFGGAIYSRVFGSVDLRLINCMLRANEASTDGGAIFNEAFSTTLDRCTLLDNKAGANGGGVYNDGASTSTLDKCTLTSNLAQNGNGGGLYMNSGTIKNSLFHENQAQNGGGIFAYSAANSTLSISNSTFSANQATQNGGGIFNRESLQLTASTLYQNQAIRAGSSIYQDALGSLTLWQNIIAGEESRADIDFHMLSSMSSKGNNLVGNGEGFDGWLNSDLHGRLDSLINPLLDSLADNGGLTMTHALKTGSPAISTGALLFLLPVDVLLDQRGYTRINNPQDSISDIGAYERHATQISSESIFSCEDSDSDIIALKDITLSDFTGGAFGVGDSLTLVFTLTNGFEFEPGSGSVEFEGDGIQGAGERILVTSDRLVIIYDRTFTSELNAITISDLKIKASSLGFNEGNLIRVGGTAKQVGNMPEDSVALVNFVGLPILSGETFSQNFNSSNGGWFPLNRDNLWEWKIPDGSVISSDNPNAKSWTTLANGGRYGRNDISILLSSCFDLSQLNNPFVSLDIWSDALDNFDGTVLQYQVEGEDKWETVGSDTTGVAWYDNIRILSNPGIPEEDKESFPYGWTGRDSTWIAARHLLPPLSDSAKSKVRFRMVFASGASVHPDQTNNGFAFDNFFIGDQEIKLLLEQFTNLEEADVTERLLTENPEAIVPIRYFVDQRETFYDNNPVGPRTRALYYGVSEAGVSVIGGNEYMGLTKNIQEDFLARSILRGSIFNIEVDPVNQDSSIQITSAGEFVNEEVIVYMALVENDVLDRGSSYDYVFRKFLPNAAGQSFWNWEVNETKVFPLSWFEDQPSISDYVTDTSKLRLVIFVQNQQTKEVYQAAKAKVWPSLLSALEEREGQLREDAELALYPNPASDYITLQTGQLSEKPIKVSCYSPHGAIVKEFHFDGNQSFYRLPIGDLAAGWYYVRVETIEKIWLQERVVVIR